MLKFSKLYRKRRSDVPISNRDLERASPTNSTTADVDTIAVLDEAEEEAFRNLRELDGSSLNNLQRTLGSQEALDIAKQEMRDLKKTSIEIDRLFERVLVQIIQMRSSASTVALHNLQSAQVEIDNMENAWRMQYDAYKEVLLWSQRHAGRVATGIEQLLTQLLPFLRDKQNSLESKKGEIGVFIMSIPKWDTNAQHIASSFQKLRNNMVCFRTILHEFINSYATEPLPSLLAQRAQLQHELDELAEKIERLDNGAYTDAGIPSLMILGLLCPALQRKIETECLKVSKSQSNKQKARLGASIQGYDDKITSRGGWGPTLVITLPGPNDDFHRLSCQLKPFCQVWTSIRADLQRARDYLEDQGQRVSEGLFDSFTSATAALYKVLYQTLREYERAISA